MKKKTLSKVKAETWTLFSKCIRLRDCLKTTGTKEHGKCITCGRLVKRQEADAGHYVSRRYTATFFDETNVHLQCKQCNSFGMSDFAVRKEYERQLEKMYGEGYGVLLEDKALEIKKYTIPELEELQKELKEKIARLE